MNKKNLLLFMGLFFSSLAFSQNSKDFLPADHPIAIAAPHLPRMAKNDGVGQVFYGINDRTYSRDKSEATIRAWMKTHPAELLKYKGAISKFLAGFNAAKATASQQAEHDDLKSQWLMIRQLIAE